MRSGREREYTSRPDVLSLSLIITFLIISGAADSNADSATRKVALNEPFEIKLEANPTTGYKWEVSYDKEFLRLDSESHKTDPSKAADRVGVSGVTTFVFVPIKAGKTTIDFRYKRPWEKEIVRKKSYRVTIGP